MIRGYRDFYYNVTDMKRAQSFYERALSMKAVYETEYWTTMNIGNLNLGLHWSEGQSIPKTPRDSHGQSCGGTLTFHSDNIAEEKIQIEKAGGKAIQRTNDV